MITLKGYTANLLCLSSDQKPTDADINTIIRELDTNTYYYFDGSDWNEMPGGGGGGGFVPTEDQLAAMNSGATTAKIEQIETNKNNISLIMDCGYDLKPPVDKWENGKLIGSNGKIVDYEGYFASANFIKLPENATSITLYASTGSMYVGKYSAPNEDAFTERVQVASGGTTITSPYIRVSVLGTLSDYSGVGIFANTNLKAELDKINTKSVKNINDEIGYIVNNKIAIGGTTLMTANDVSIGDELQFDFKAISTTGYIQIYDTNNTRIGYFGKTSSSKAQTEYVEKYTIPANFAYANVSGTVEINKITKHTISQKIEQYPLTSMPDYIVRNLAYRPLGKLTKPYICISCDDGRSELATYTIPMITQKNVPITFCLWSTCEVMADNTYQNLVKAAITNLGCEVAQHGERPWATGAQWNQAVPDEAELTAFWESEKVAFTAAGITVKGAACPYGYTTARVIAQAGGHFGVHRAVYGDGDEFNVVYPYYCTGERSNIYTLRAENLKNHDMTYWQAAIDYAIAHNYLLCIYFHDWDLTTVNSDGRTGKQNLEDIIDYAKSQNLTFCNIGDIPYLV